MKNQKKNQKWLQEEDFVLNCLNSLNNLRKWAEQNEQGTE